MRLDAQLHTHPWREGTQQERTQHLIDARREQLRNYEADRPLNVVLLGLCLPLGAWLLSYLAPLVEWFKVSLTPMLAIAALLFLGALVFVNIYAVPFLFWRAQRTLGRALSTSDTIVRGFVALDSLRGTPHTLMDCHVQEHVITPIEVHIDTEGPNPAIHWKPAGDAQRTRLQLVDTGLPTDHRQRTIPSTGQISLAEEDRPGFDVTRSTAGPERIALTCRAHGPEGIERVSLICPRPDGMDDQTYNALPALNREGIQVDAKDSGHLLAALHAVAAAHGRSLEVPVHQPHVQTIKAF